MRWLLPSLDHLLQVYLYLDLDLLDLVDLVDLPDLTDLVDLLDLADLVDLLDLLDLVGLVMVVGFVDKHLGVRAAVAGGGVADPIGRPR